MKTHKKNEESNTIQSNMLNMIICLLAILGQPRFPLRHNYQMLNGYQDPIQTMTNFNKSPLQYKNISTLTKAPSWIFILFYLFIY